MNYFTLKTLLHNDLQFTYLKWVLNNFNHVQKLKLHLQIDALYTKDTLIKGDFVDANFIRNYFMPDVTDTIIHFQFYIISKCHSHLNNTDKIINSFKIHQFFIDHQWTNVTCFFDPFKSYQHLSSLILHIPQFVNGLS
jgi:hypothetical protein